MCGEAFERLVLAGDLTIRTAKQLHGQLLAALEQHAHLEIDCTDASEVDLSFFQLLIAARKSAARTGRTVTLRLAPGGMVEDALRRAGLLQLIPSQAA